MSIRYSYANTNPTLVLDFANSKQLDPRITFTRDSIATRVSEEGYIETVANNIPRFDFDGSTKVSKGLLLEESRTNLISYSGPFSTNSFVDSNVTVTLANTASPTGNTDGNLLTSTLSGGSNICFVDFNVSITANTTYTFSMFLKQGTSPRSTINLYYTGGTFVQAVGTVTWGASPTYAVTGSSLATGGIQNYGNGWYRCYLSLNSGINNTLCTSRVYVRDQGTTNVSGETVYAWGRQTELGSFPTSYIPTFGATVTRSADSAVMTGTNFSSWYNQSQGTFIRIMTVNETVNGAPAGIYSTTVYDGTSSNWMATRLISLVSPSSPYADIIGQTGGVYQFDTANFGFDWTKTIRQAFAYANNNVGFCLNAGTVDVDTLVTLPTVNRMILLGASELNTNAGRSGTLSKIAYYPVRLSNAQLQTLTIVP